MRPELRLFLLDECVVNPPPMVADARAIPLAAMLVPKVIEFAIGGIATMLKKAGAEESAQATAGELANLYGTDDEQRLSVNRRLRCLLGVYGIFADEDGRPTKESDIALKRLEAKGLIPKNADIAIVFEAMLVPTADETAFYLETRHFSVRDFIGDRNKDDRVYVATVSVTTPNATADGSTIALGHVALGRVGKGTLPIPPDGPLGEYPRYRSNLMPWNRITTDAKEVYESDVKRNEARNKSYMPVTFNLTLSETADGNKFLAALGDLLAGGKADAAKAISGLLIPRDPEEKAREEADAAEKLYKPEEDAHIAVKEAEAALAAGAPEQREILQAKLAKAKRALELARRLRKAAGLPDLP